VARALVLHERVAERPRPVVHRKGRDPVAVALELAVRVELHQLDRERRFADHRRQSGEQGAQSGGPVDAERPFTPAQAEGLEHAGEPQHVVGVEVGDEHLFELHQPDRAHELPLGSLAAVEQQPVATAPHQRGG
jgi:hypothetical protein